MAKIAVESESIYKRSDTGELVPGPTKYQLACGDGWTVSDVICTAGPQDRAFEEQYSRVCIAVVVSGSFQYQSISGRALMTPGSLLLGRARQYFMCSHEHATGDRCVAFEYEPEYFEYLANEAGVTTSNSHLPLRLPPVSELSMLVARTWAGVIEFSNTLRNERRKLSSGNCTTASQENPKLLSAGTSDWDEISLELAGRIVTIGSGFKSKPQNPPSAEARTTRVVRMIDSQPDGNHDLVSLAREAKLSRYHFLRTFQELTGLTPHQYVLRARLRRAATRLLSERARVLDIALESGFSDLSNFTRAFRREFGVSPRIFRYSCA